jgi:hypothetical protein
MCDIHGVSGAGLFSSVIQPVTVLTGTDVSFTVKMAAGEFTKILLLLNCDLHLLQGVASLGSKKTNTTGVLNCR